jgi:prolyl-tRNA synthetase
MDLIGIPHRFVIGERGIDEGVIEYKKRSAKETTVIPAESIISFLTTSLS